MIWVSSFSGYDPSKFLPGHDLGKFLSGFDSEDMISNSAFNAIQKSFLTQWSIFPCQWKGHWDFFLAWIDCIFLAHLSLHFVHKCWVVLIKLTQHTETAYQWLSYVQGTKVKKKVVQKKKCPYDFTVKGFLIHSWHQMGGGGGWHFKRDVFCWKHNFYQQLPQDPK